MNKRQTVAFHTLGCKLNFAETSTIARQFKDRGYNKVDFTEAADVYVINTCSVTENADRECKLHVNRALHTNPDSFVAIIGCYAQLKPHAIASIPGVSLVLGATEKFNVVNYINDLKVKQQAQVFACDINDSNVFTSSFSNGDRTRVFLKVQDGCDYGCAFCTIPLARGKSRSDTVEHVLQQTEKIIAAGAKEIVLTGVNLGDFGKIHPDEKHDATFFDLVKSLDAQEGTIRYRISSIEPNLLTDAVIEHVSTSQKFMPHFHIPLQSGSDKILKLMRRRYLTNLYVSRVEKIKALIPHACIGVDVITGFPGETNADFEETYNFLNKLDVSYLHVFTYSERENTLAKEMNDVVPISERKRRTNMLRILSEKKLRCFYELQAGKEMNVLFENDHKNGFMHGYTENYVKVKTPYNPALVNSIERCKTGMPDERNEVPCEVFSLETV
jgi:threonylcarbamoyladenosine tRNA methylthiotransferase MtaB